MKNKKIIAVLVFAAAVIAVIASLAFIINGTVGKNSTADTSATTGTESTSASDSGTAEEDFVFPPLCGIHKFGDDGVCDVCYLLSDEVAVNGSWGLYLKKGAYLPETVRLPYCTRISGACFFGQSNISRIYIPDTVKVIGASAFEDCTFLEEIILPEGLEEIGARAFFNCGELDTVHIPSSVETIGAGAFGCMKKGFGVTVGEGNLNFPGIVEVARQIGVRHYVVEQDICEGDSLECAARSYGYVKTLIGEEN